MKAEVKTIKKLQKESDAEFKRYMQENPQASPSDNQIWLDLESQVQEMTKVLFLTLPHDKSGGYVLGYIPYRIIGEYLVFADSAPGGHTGMGMRGGYRRFIAVHIKTGMIRRNEFDRHRDPYGWWMNLLKSDEGKLTDEEWSQLEVKDEQTRLWKKLGIE